MASISVAKIERTRTQNGPQKKKEGSRYSGRTMLRWESHPEGLAALCAMYGYSGFWGTDDEFRVKRTVKDLNYHPDRIMEMFAVTIPVIFDLYEEKTGNQLTSNVVSNRFHKMFYGYAKAGSTKKGEDAHCQLSKEHPKQNAFRRKAMEIVETRLREVGWFAPNMDNWDFAPLIQLIAEEKKRRREEKKAEREARKNARVP